MGERLSGGNVAVALLANAVATGAHRSKSVDEFAGQEFDYVITVCDNANENCPVFPGRTERLHWSFDDPAAAMGERDARLTVFRRVRDEIASRLRAFIAQGED